MIWLWSMGDNDNKLEYSKLIVSKLCKFEKGEYISKLSTAKRVYEKYPDNGFWDWLFLNCEIKVDNPSFFLTKDGADFLIKKQKLRNFLPFKKLDLKVQDGKFGEDKSIKKKNLNVIDFIKNDKEKQKHS